MLGSLVDKHLVVRREASDSAVRFGFLQTIHAYASARLEESGELARIHRQHAEVVADLVERAELDLDSGCQPA